MKTAIPRKAFTTDGFLVRQELTGAVPYGKRTSDYNGCGWIAAYNFLKSTGRRPSLKRLLGKLKNKLLFGGHWGTNPFALYGFLKRSGYPQLKRAFRPKSAANAAARAGILMYYTGNGFHFTAFTAYTDDILTFYNTGGCEPSRATMKSFMLKNISLPLIFLMYI